MAQETFKQIAQSRAQLKSCFFRAFFRSSPCCIHVAHLPKSPATTAKSLDGIFNVAGSRIAIAIIDIFARDKSKKFCVSRRVPESEPQSIIRDFRTLRSLAPSDSSGFGAFGPKVQTLCRFGFDHQAGYAKNCVLVCLSKIISPDNSRRRRFCVFSSWERNDPREKVSTPGVRVWDAWF